MDPKKQDLNPELKQIYDRVMNTQVPNKPVNPPAPQAAAPTPVEQTPPVPAQPAMPQPQPTPQPISGAKSFVFTGNKIITPQGANQNATQTTSTKKGIPGSLIAVLIVILVIAWGALWAKIFGLF